MRLTATGLLIGMIALAGCGDTPRITEDAKNRVAGAALTISQQCIIGDANESRIEDAVTDLLDARDEFGDQTFTLSDELADVTVQDIIDRQAALMDENDCVPEQQDRLS